MLSGESTPLLKESIQLLEANEALDVDVNHKNAVLFSGTKVFQITFAREILDGGCLSLVLRISFGTTQSRLVRTLIFSPERASAKTFLTSFTIFLLILAIAASWYVWAKDIESDS